MQLQQQQSLLSCKFYRNVCSPRKNLNLSGIIQTSGHSQGSQLWGFFPVVRTCFQMQVSKIIYQHLNKAFFFFLPCHRCHLFRKQRPILLPKLTTYLGRWYQVFRFENVNIVFVSRHTSGNTTCTYKS